MELLQRLEDRGYPTEYLLSRIKGRRSRLIVDWRPLIYEAAPADYLASTRYQGFVKERSQEGIWRNLIREFRWVYGQMNGDLRRIFSPFFFYNELRTLLICLRHLNDQRSGKADELLSISLLGDEIKKIILTCTDLRSAVEGLERVLVPRSDRFSGLTGVYDEDGLRGVEQQLTNTYLTVIVAADLHRLMRAFFVRLIDARNIMSLYKYLRLDQSTRPLFIPGGSIGEARFLGVVAGQDLLSVNGLVREFTGMKIDTPDPTKVEIALYKSITRFLKKEGREPFGAGPVLDYLWKCTLEVMNLSVLLQCKDLERDLVIAELVQ